ncbi:MAG: class I tRNA ligase family protein [Patescibacteria group bacterium]
MSKFYLTTPIYYINDRPHVGHAYTTLMADVFARYRRSRGDDVFFLTGTDEHGAKIAASAEAQQMTPQAFADQNSALFQEVWHALNIQYDFFIRTTSSEHRECVRVLMEKLRQQDDLYEGVYEGLYCIGCEKFLTEKELVDGKCPDHKKIPERIQEKNYFFRLGKYLPRVKAAIDAGDMEIVPEGRRSEVLSLFDQGLADLSVSREHVKWGIPLPFDPSQRIYVWVEALQNYLSGIGYGRDPDQFARFWPADVHFMGKEILKFHAIFWPCLLLAAGLALPRKIFVHGHFTINGEKMSKSLGNVINPVDMIPTYGVDGTRYLLLSQFPIHQDGDLQEARFAEKYNADLANNLGNLISRVSTIIDKDLSGQVRHGSSNIDRSLYDEFMLNLKSYESLDWVMTRIDDVNKLIDTNKPWNLAKAGRVDDLREAMSLFVAHILDISIFLSPFMPETAKTIFDHFSRDRIQKIQPLFPRI